MSSGRVGVGVIGLGVGEQHALAFAAHPDCELRAVCDRDQAKLAEVSQRLPVCRRYLRADELIEDPTVDVVAVASNDDDHYLQIMHALRSGKHVFCEKPMCLKAKELKDICSVWRSAGKLRLSTNTVLRRSPRFRWLRDSIAGGIFGDVYCVEADYLYGRLHKLTDGWRGKIDGYSVMLGGGVHMVDLLLWITGQRPVEVFSFGSGLASRNSSYQGNDLALAVLRFENGMIAKVGANFASVHPHFHRVVVYGTKATFENPPEDPRRPARLWTTRDPDEAPHPVDQAYPGVKKGDLVPAFVDAVLGRGEPDVVEDEVFAALSVCLAIDESMREGRSVRVNYESALR